jgi:predicted MPP superfamily phosphohydrolase
MYLQNELLLSAPLAVYACLRVRALIGPKSLKNLWAAFFVLVAAGYPMAESLSHGKGDGWASAVMIFGYCALPFLLYLIMTVALVDLSVGFLRLARVASREAVRSRPFRTRRLLVSLAVPLLVVGYGVVNHRMLRAKEYRIEVPRRSSTAGELTVVFMADLHFRALTPDRLLEELVAKVNARKPDVILIGGDILEGDRRDEDTGRYERAFRRMVSKYGIYGVPGNHERFNRAGTDGFLERAGIRLLQDEAVPLDGALTLAGRKDIRSRNRKSVAELLSAAPRDLPVILLSHRPMGFDEARRSGADIQLSGHTHHGQLFPVNLITIRQFDLSWGHLEKGGAHLFVTSGVQGWGPPVRTVGASEILVLHIALREAPGMEDRAEIDTGSRIPVG